MTLVHNAYSDWLRVANAESTKEWAKTHHLNPPKLFISNLGKCSRAAFFHSVQHLPSHPFHAEETHPSSNYVLSLMQQGLTDEDDTERALRYMYDRNLRTQPTVGDVQSRITGLSERRNGHANGELIEQLEILLQTLKNGKK
jgi:hypothetical protein